jgi:hypothetical protein
MHARHLSLLVSLFIGACSYGQPIITDSTYHRMPDRDKAMDAIRFDLDSYNDTMRVYREALEGATSTVDASVPVGEERKARLGRLRRDVKELDNEMARLRKQMKKAVPPFDEAAGRCSRLVQRVKALRIRLLAEGVRPEQ